MNSCILPLPPNDHPTTAQGSPGVVGGHPEITIFPPTPAGLKTAVLTCRAPQGGRSWKIGDSTREPRHWRGAPCQRKKWNGTRVRIAAQWRLQANQIVPLPPPPHPPHPPENWYPGRRVERSKSKNTLRDNFVSQNDDFTKGQASDIIKWGMLRECPPLQKKVGIWLPRVRFM